MQKCPLCGKELEAILEHISIHHKIRNLDEVKHVVEEEEIKEAKRKAFKKYSEELNVKLSNKEITPEQYRQLVMKWWE
jgi:hypothetical protein